VTKPAGSGTTVIEPPPLLKGTVSKVVGSVKDEKAGFELKANENVAARTSALTVKSTVPIDEV